MDQQIVLRDECNEGITDIPELAEMHQEPRNWHEAEPKHGHETPPKPPNEIMKDENGASNAAFKSISTEQSVNEACATAEQSETCQTDEKHPTAGYELHDDVSSIFSDKDMSDIREREILQEALLQLKKDNPFGFSDTCSECSDDLSEGDRRSDVSCYFGLPDTHPIQGNAVENVVKNAAETSLNASEPETIQQGTELHQQMHCQDATKPQHQNHLQHMLRGMLQSPVFEKEAHATMDCLNGVPKMGDAFCGSDCSDSGYISDIAVLARENEKLSEIIDHLQVTSNPLPEGNGCIELVDRYVGKEQYDMVENERLELESKLREKERRIREQDRTAEEDRYEREEECRILKRSLTKAEKKSEEKAKELQSCEAKIKEATTKHFKQLSSLQCELESKREENFKLEETIITLQKRNADFERELQGMKQHIVKFEAQERQLEERHRRDIGQLEEYLEMEAQEKNKLKQDVEALCQELVQTKARVLKEARKHGAEEPKPKTEDKKLGVTGIQTITKSSPNMVAVPETQVVEERIIAESETTQEGIGHDVDIEKRIQEEQQRRKKLEEENRVMSAALLSGDYSLLQSLYSDGVFSNTDAKNVQKKLSETLKELKEVRLKNEEGEGELEQLKRKSERLERQVAQMRELEDKNEELDVELERAKRKQHEVQRAAENTREDMEEMTATMQKLKDDNLAYKDETERLTLKIKQTEDLLAETKNEVVKSLEEEKMAKLHELKTKQEEAEEKNKRLELKNDKLRQDLHKTDEMIRASEEKFSLEKSELIAAHKKEIQHVEEKFTLQQDELNTTAKMVRGVTEEWEKMLRNTVSRNEEMLQKIGEEKRKVQEELLRKTQEMNRQLEMCKCNPAEQPSRGMDEDYQDEPGQRRASYFEANVQHKQNKGVSMTTENVQAEPREPEKSSHGADTYTKEELEDKIQALALKHEVEMKDLREKLSNDNKEARERLKMEMSKSIVMKSVILESRIEGLVVQIIQEERQRNRRRVIQYEREKEKYNITIRALQDKIQVCESQRRALEEEKEEFGVTVSRLSNDLRSSKEEANEREERVVKKMEEEFEQEKQRLQETSETHIERTKEKMEEEYCRKMMSERQKYEEDIQQLTAAVILFKEKLEQKELKCEECSKSADNETSTTKDQSETREKLEQEQERKLLKEKENISSTLENLQREIKQLEANRQQLQIELHDRREMNNRVILQHMYPFRVDAPEVYLGLENKSHQQHEKDVLKDRARELEGEVERLREQMHQQETRSRREHVQIRRKFQSEKDEMEEEFRREKDGWREQMSVLAAKANLRRVQAALDGGKSLTMRNSHVFHRNHVTRTKPEHLMKTYGLAFT